MAIYRTSHRRSVSHCHVRPHPVGPCDSREWTRAERQQERALVASLHPNVVEIRAPSRKYNCHGYAFARAHGLFEFPDLFIVDDFSQVPTEEARIGDVLVYEDEEGEFTHSGFVKEVIDGEITKLRSKWGKVAAYVHDPFDVDPSFGTPTRLLRRHRRRRTATAIR